jgi:hypothetical protein
LTPKCQTWKGTMTVFKPISLFTLVVGGSLGSMLAKSMGKWISYVQKNPWYGDLQGNSFH